MAMTLGTYGGDPLVRRDNIRPFIWMQVFGGGNNYTPENPGGVDPRWINSPWILIDKAHLAMLRARTYEGVLHVTPGTAKGRPYPASGWHATTPKAIAQLDAGALVWPDQHWSYFTGVMAVPSQTSIDCGDNPVVAEPEFIAEATRDFASIGVRRIWFDQGELLTPEQRDRVVALGGFRDGYGIEAYTLNDIGPGRGPGGRMYTIAPSGPALALSSFHAKYDPLNLFVAPSTGGPYCVVIEYGYMGDERSLDSLAERGFMICAAYGASPWVFDWMAKNERYNR